MYLLSSLIFQVFLSIGAVFQSRLLVSLNSRGTGRSKVVKCRSRSPKTFLDWFFCVTRHLGSSYDSHCKIYIDCVSYIFFYFPCFFISLYLFQYVYVSGFFSHSPNLSKYPNSFSISRLCLFFDCGDPKSFILKTSLGI